MRGENEETIFLKDYVESPYLIEKVELDEIGAGRVADVAGAPLSATANGAPWWLTSGLPPASTIRSASRMACRPLAITPMRAMVSST